MGFLDITQPPYNVTIPWTGSDATSPDYWAPLQQAANDLAAGNWSLIDYKGGDGGKILMPPWTVSIGQKLVLPDGVSLQGHGKASSCLLMRNGFNPASHFIDFGDSTSGHASFGGQIKDMHIASQNTCVANSGSFLIFSNNVQDTQDMISNCWLDSSYFGGIKYLGGVGGATMIEFNNLTVNCRDAGSLGNVPMVVRVGSSTMVRIDGFEPSVGWLGPAENQIAKPGSYGLICLGGSYQLSRFHPEQVETCVHFGATTPPIEGDIYADNIAELDWFTGGGGLKNMVTIEHTYQWANKIWMNKMMRKGVWIGPTVNNGNGTSVYTDILDWTRF